MTQKEVDEFNVQFEAYFGRDDLTIYDIISAANLAKEYNSKYGMNKTIPGYVSVILRSGGTNTNIEEKKDIELINDEYIYVNNKGEELQKYKCENKGPVDSKNLQHPNAAIKYMEYGRGYKVISITFEKV